VRRRGWLGPTTTEAVKSVGPPNAKAKLTKPHAPDYKVREWMGGFVSFNASVDGGAYMSTSSPRLEARDSGQFHLLEAEE
jgi:hypothetical protein